MCDYFVNNANAGLLVKSKAIYYRKNEPYISALVDNVNNGKKSKILILHRNISAHRKKIKTLFYIIRADVID